jgi:phosphoribosylformylglycinamidine synthase subunit PurSL
MLWEVEIRPVPQETDQESLRILHECEALQLGSIHQVETARSFLIEGELDQSEIESAAKNLLSDPVVESFNIHQVSSRNGNSQQNGKLLLNVLLKPGVTDNVGTSTQNALSSLGFDISAVQTCRKYWINSDSDDQEMNKLESKILSNDAIERVIRGPLNLDGISLGSEYSFSLIHIPIRTMSDDDLMVLSQQGQLYLNLTEMQTIQKHFVELDRDPTDIELESVAQTWSEHCSHKTLAGRIRYQHDGTEFLYENMLKETIFAATQQIRKDLGDDDWCVSVFEDNAGIVTFDEKQNVCIKVETHNHPSALEPYGGANTGIGGVIRDPIGTGMGARPICNTDVFCFGYPETENDALPSGVLHPKTVARGVVSGVRDYGNRMGIPTVNGSVFFDDRYLGNPLVYCGNVAMIPVDKCQKNLQVGDYIVTVGGRTGRDGIHGATFSSAELTEDSEMLSSGAVQIGNAITEKMVADVIMEARDRNLYNSITDCGAGGFSSAVGEMGEKTGAEVWLDKAPLKYSGLNYTEIWISEAQERMVLSVPENNWEEFNALCSAEGVEATIIGKFTDTHQLVLKYQDQEVGNVSMEFLHDGRPPVIREAIYEKPEEKELSFLQVHNLAQDLLGILASHNVCSKEWIIRQYDHEVQAGSVVKPLVGIQNDGPSDAAVVRPDLTSSRGLVVSNGMNPHYGDFDTYWMAASAIDEAIRNAVAVGADPSKIAILDNFCWGNTDRPEILGSLVRAAIACYDAAVVYKTPFISGKDSLNNEFSFVDDNGEKQNVTIPSSLLISALGQIDDISQSVTMDLKEAGNAIYLVGSTMNEMGGSHYSHIHNLTGGSVPKVDFHAASKLYEKIHESNQDNLFRSCHDLSEGGLAVAAAEMAFAGGLGMEIHLESLSEESGIKNSTILLFSESNSRFLVEIKPENCQAFEEKLAGLPCVKLGTVLKEQDFIVKDDSDTPILQLGIDNMKSAWQQTLAWD